MGKPGGMDRTCKPNDARTAYGREVVIKDGEIEWYTKNKAPALFG